MPLTEFQSELAKLLSLTRSEDSHLAGGAALHFQPNSIRYSEDLDYFHDSDVRVASAFEADLKLMQQNKYQVNVELRQPGYVRCIVKKKNQATKVEWAYDSSWRFMPAQKHPEYGFILHPVDLAINKLLALAGRDESRDYLDTIYNHENILSLGAQCWAACGKDPGYSPGSLLELLKRRGKYRDEDFSRLHLAIKIDIKELKQRWLSAIEQAESFISKAPLDSLGCLFYSTSKKKFITPDFSKPDQEFLIHFGKPSGILPLIK